jgi:hypothetical protein
VAQVRIDWFRVITDILRAGYSIHSVAQVIKVPRSTLMGWKQGAEPRYTEGECLVSFWCQAVGRGRESLPLVAVGDWWSYHAKV